MVHTLPPGWKFEPLHKHCPQCGFNLSEDFVAPENDEAEPEIPVEQDPGVLRLTADASQVLRTLSSLSEIAARAPQLRQAVLDVLDGLPQSGRAYTEDRSTAVAGELRIRLEIPDPLDALVAAMRARDVRPPVVE